MSGNKAHRRPVSIVSIIALLIVGLNLATGSAQAAPAAMLSQPAASFTADRLPTVQINGVVWSTDVAGDTVFAGGSFTRARPAGSAAGTNETVRNNFLAFDIRTGNLITSFAPDLNGQVLDVAVSPDKSRVYVVGDFTTANGQARRRVAAYNASTGALITSFNPVGVNSRARAVIATNDTVYVGGGFLGAGGTARENLAAFRASDGGLLPWAPSADLAVWGLAVTPDGQNVFTSGQFTTLNGEAAYGIGKLGGASGQLDTTWHPEVRNAGPDAAIGSIRIQGGFLYGSTWHFGPGGNLEGVFKVPMNTGTVEWVTDCHGDMYDSFMIDGTVYAAGHSHYCGNMGGGFPQYPQWKFQHAIAFSDTVTGDILNDVHGYPNWSGVKPGPALVNWLPDMAIGSYTGQYQAGWTVTGTSDFLVYGGEFPRVNGTAQQGLVRYGKRPVAPGSQGPIFVGGSFVPQASPQSANSVRITWPAAYDRDDQSLTYRLYRGGTVIHTRTAASTWWNLPALGYVDTTVSAGSTNSYRLTASDPGGNTVFSSTTSYTHPSSVPVSSLYADSVASAGATLYWPLNDTRTGSPMAIRDRAGSNDGVADSDVNAGQDGAVPGDPGMTFGTAQPNQPWGRIYAKGTEYAPDTFTVQAWVKTNTNRGGRILGFGDLQFGDSGHRDRHVYMDNSGRILFGVRAVNGSNRTVTSGKSYNDNNWHMITASMGPRGMELFVDGVRVARRSDTTEGESYLGYWRVQGDNLSGWTSRPSSDNFTGSIDEIAVYPAALSQQTILQQYAASGRTSVVPEAPADTYGAAVYADDPDLFWRFDETTGTTAADSGASLNSGTYRSGVTLGQSGIIAGNSAAQFDGSNDVVYSNAQFSNPTTFSTEAWFKTTTTAGGKIIGFGNAQNGESSSYDRHVYMLNNGRLVFGVWTGQVNTIETSAPFNDGDWHHVVATQSATGMKLYVDGVVQGTHPQANAQGYDGYWRVGGDSSWAGAQYFNGIIDEAAVYSHELSPSRITAHYLAAGGAVNQAPTADFSLSASQRRVVFNGSGADGDGTVVAYSWDFGDGSTSSEQNPTHVYPAAGNYTATLTVTDNKGATGSTSKPVTATAGALPGGNYGASVFADNPRIYWRLGEAAGEVAKDASGSLSDGTIMGAPVLGRPGAVSHPDTAVLFDGAGKYVTSNDSFVNPTTYTEEAWFRTASDSGGKVMGFGCTVESPSPCYDRHIYLQGDGRVVFGTYTGAMNIITTDASYNDGKWHHVVASQSPNGMKLYLDGVPAGTNPQTGAENYTGYLHVGGDNTWGSDPWFDGEIDEVALYLAELGPDRVAAHFLAAQPGPNQDPIASFTVTKTDLTIVADASNSSDPDGTVASVSWDFGDGNTSTDVVATHTYASGGTFVVTLIVTDNQGATATKTASVAVQGANVNPVASFTATVTDLTAILDASGSTDPDGTIATYEWDFGDGTTGSGASATHTYGQADTFTITLKVTDNSGGTHTTTRSITTTMPANQPPTAQFDFTIDQQLVNFNATGSTDPDGTISGYAWNFGDGTTGTGATPTHTYAPGTYTATLTVTDNGGANGSTSLEVTVAAAARIATDSFDRTVVNGWGTADLGGVWTGSGSASNFSVAGGLGNIRMATGSGPGIYLNSVSAQDVELQSSVSYDKPGSGGGIYSSFIVRRIGTSDYRTVLRTTATGVSLQIQRTVNGSATVIGSTVALPGGALAPGQTVLVKFRVVGVGPTTLSTKAWRSGDTEPQNWMVTTTDPTATLQNPGGVGLYSYLSGSANNGPIVARLADFMAIPG